MPWATRLYDRGLMFENEDQTSLAPLVRRARDHSRRDGRAASSSAPATEVTRIRDDIGITIGTVTRSDGRFIAKMLGEHLLGTLDTFAAAERAIRENGWLRFRIDGRMPA
jgi:hypothetical protein